MVYLSKMVIFHGYVSLPEGNYWTSQIMLIISLSNIMMFNDIPANQSGQSIQWDSSMLN